MYTDALRNLNYEYAKACATRYNIQPAEQKKVLDRLYSEYLNGNIKGYSAYNRARSQEQAAILAKNMGMGREKELQAALRSYYMHLSVTHVEEPQRIERNHQLRSAEPERQNIARQAYIYALRNNRHDSASKILEISGLEEPKGLKEAIESYRKQLEADHVAALKTAESNKLGELIITEAATKVFHLLTNARKFEQAADFSISHELDRALTEPVAIRAFVSEFRNNRFKTARRLSNKYSAIIGERIKQEVAEGYHRAISNINTAVAGTIAQTFKIPIADQEKKILDVIDRYHLYGEYEKKLKDYAASLGPKNLLRKKQQNPAAK